MIHILIQLQQRTYWVISHVVTLFSTHFNRFWTSFVVCWKRFIKLPSNDLWIDLSRSQYNVSYLMLYQLIWVVDHIRYLLCPMSDQLISVSNVLSQLICVSNVQSQLIWVSNVLSTTWVVDHIRYLLCLMSYQLISVVDYIRYLLCPMSYQLILIVDDISYLLYPM